MRTQLTSPGKNTNVTNSNSNIPPGRWVLKRDGGPAREGPALLQGKAVCGLCGSRMNVHYNVRKNGMIPNYVCVGRGRHYRDPLCQSILGTSIDAAIGQLLIDTVAPMALELALAVQPRDYLTPG